MSAQDHKPRLDALLASDYPSLLKLDEDTWFADEDALTSYEHVELIAAIEDRFDLDIEDEEMIEENFGSRAAILGYLERNAG